MSDSVIPHITIEFVGLAGHRARQPQDELAAANVQDVLRHLCTRFPQFVDSDANGRVQLRRSWILNINGDRFVSEPGEVLQDGDVVLLMSVDAGG